MSVLTDTWRFLMQRRLWPVAILLIAAAVAVPTAAGLRADRRARCRPPPRSRATSASVLATEPIVAPAADADRSGRRQVLGSSKNPFKPQATPTPEPKPARSDARHAGGDGPGRDRSRRHDRRRLARPRSTPVTPAPAKKKYELNELTVRFGPSDATTRPPRKDVKRLQALPSSDEPVLIYLGVLKDKRTAVFLVDSGVIAQGDGTCMPSRTTCETIHIKEGETEFFDVVPEDAGDGTTPAAGTGAQFQLDVIKIRKKVTTSAKQAKKSLARVSKSGRKILKARIAGDGPLRYRYNARTGRLEKLSHKAYKAIVAKAAHAARAHF